MPFGDRRGPAGMGPMTGRGAGFCAGYNTPGYVNFTAGRGAGMGMGRSGGRGHRNMYYVTGLAGWQRTGYGVPFSGYEFNQSATAPVPQSPEQELDMLKSQADSLEKTLTSIQQRIQQFDETQQNKD